ncbi:MAG: hypothetical protein HY657_01875 [Acidobacteria bacterium]|nr:hypothetical protein [Acidobacteriota bacterium]
MRAFGGVLLALLLVQPARPAAQQPTLDALLLGGAAYVAEFVSRFSNVVAEERSVQRLIQERRNREIGSDFLIVQVPGTSVWQSFRDVFEVDGKPVRDRDDRLQQLFLEPSDNSFRRAREIAEAGARFNLEGVGTLNDPLAAMAFLQDQYRSRFRWTLVRNDRDVGPDIWSVRFQENVRPTVFLAAGNRDLPANGLIWIERATGRVARTELRIDRPGAAVTSSFGLTIAVPGRSEVVTLYGFDERFGINVPVETRERHISGINEVTATATYGRFRRFEVTTEETVKP